jgi:hypothetical protein
MNMLGMSHALESFLSLDILIMPSIGSKFPKPGPTDRVKTPIDDEKY